MGNAVNQDKGLTSTTTGGQAQTMGATDVNFNPPKTSTAPFPNQAPNDTATTHSTSKTQVQGGPVIRQGDKVGPPSNPAHPNTGGGANAAGNPYRQDAVGQNGSPNMRVEGTPPTRLTDPTTQNNKNTTGQFTESGPPKETPGAGGTPKEACHILEVKIECKHGRIQGPDKILEILGASASANDAGVLNTALGGKLGETADKVAEHVPKPEKGDEHAERVDEEVTLTAKRIDARTKGNPSCEPKTHTKWILERSGGIRSNPKREEVVAKDTYKLKGDWLNYGGELKYEGGIAAKKGAVKRDFLQGVLDKKNAERKAQGRKPIGLDKLGPSYRTAAKKAAEYEQWNAGNLNKAMEVASKAVELGTFLEILFARKFAPTIAVKAEACSGAQDFKIRLFPPIKAEFQITPFSPEIKALKSAIAALEKMLKVFKKLSSMAGLSVDAGVVLCEGGGVMMEALWKEVKEENEKAKLFKHNCDIEVEVSFGFEKLIGIHFNVGVPLAAFANVFIPGAGTELAAALNWLGVEATIGVDVDFGLAPLFKIQKECGHAIDDVKWDIDLDLTFSVFFNVKIKWKDYVEVTGGVIVEGDPSIDKLEPAWPLPQVGMKFKDGDIKVGFKGMAKADVLWWHVHQTVEYYPESCQIRYPEFTVKPLSWMSSDK